MGKGRAIAKVRMAQRSEAHVKRQVPCDRRLQRISEMKDIALPEIVVRREGLKQLQQQCVFRMSQWRISSRIHTRAVSSVKTVSAADP